MRPLLILSTHNLSAGNRQNSDMNSALVSKLCSRPNYLEASGILTYLNGINISGYMVMDDLNRLIALENYAIEMSAEFQQEAFLMVSGDQSVYLVGIGVMKFIGVLLPLSIKDKPPFTVRIGGQNYGLYEKSA